MRFIRRVLLPSAWLVIGAVVAVALVKIAFIDGTRGTEQSGAPQVDLGPRAVSVGKTTVSNVVEVKGSVAADPAVSVRSTESGTVVYLHVKSGKPVAEGTPLFQVKKARETPAQTEDAGTPPSSGSAKAGETPAVPRPPAVEYDYLDILAPASGVLTDFTVLMGQQVSVGDQVGNIDPGTYSVSGSLDAAQQYRLLDRPSKAEVTVTGGPSPFTCTDVRIGSAPTTAGGGSGGSGGGARGSSVPGAQVGPGGGPVSGGGDSGAGPSSGTVSCPVPSSVKVFPGLGASLKLTAGIAENTLAVPLTAVKGSYKEGVVWVRKSTPDAPSGGASAPGDAAAPKAAPAAPVPPGPSGAADGFEERTVSLGLNDGTRIEVTKGLKEGEEILEFIPGVQAPAGPGGMPGGPVVMGG
ncbi:MULTISPECIES: hypothetical protein [Arthrobacter]|uniref:Multidrug efflux pump subunit AcrA (Membrane-fusion protein) n=2 Tax=Arthrobacter TaxID=1663 RepID=A0ABU9KLL3_9MICC|nr:hypothetical protein [Arthrobacter sp. YJM1]MDP5227794.1 hypothetical protein [Arthrobacter sp. YJM1]